MGCTDSTALENHMNGPNQKAFLRNPHEFPTPGNEYGSKTNS